MASTSVSFPTAATRVIRGAAVAALLLLALAAGGRAAYYAVVSFEVVRWPLETVGGEATMLYESQLLARDPLGGLRALYGPQAADHFVAGNYPPLYLLLWAAEPGESGFLTGRLLSLLAAFAAAGAGGVAVYAALGGAVGRLTRAGAGALGGGLFLGTVPAFQQMVIAKPDMTALACAALGLACFEAAPGRRGTLAAGACFALGLLAKQSVGFALAAAGLAALRRGPRAAATLVLAVAAVLAVALGLLWAVAGPSLFEHLVVYNTRAWREDRFASFNGKFLGLHWPLLAAGVASAAWGLRGRPRSALTYYPLTALATLATVGAEGAGRNYYLELCLAVGLAAALGAGALLAARPARLRVLGGALLLLAALQVLQAYTVLTRGQYVPEAPPARELARRTRILHLVDAAPDPVLADDVSYLAVRGRPAVLDDDYLATIVRAKGGWSDAAVVAAVEARRYPLIITARHTNERRLRDNWGDTLAEAIYAHYDRVGEVEWLPKPAP